LPNTYHGPLPRNGILSWAGLVLFAMGIALQIWAIEKEKMLLEAFGEEYRRYMKRAKRFIPFVL
jgi:protein-S-isoprenylcysteine O-methyltransferase Ste14